VTHLVTIAADPSAVCASEVCSVNTPDSLSPQQLQAEIGRLKEEIDMRDRLVEQLSQELFRLVEGNAKIVPSADLSSGQQKHVQMLRTQLEEVEKQVEFYQAQINQRDAELYAQRQAVQELTDRASTLERVVQELPEIYKEKFSERLQPVEERVAQLQRENRQLHAELQSVNYRLAQKMKAGTIEGLDLPAFAAAEDSQAALPSLPSFALSDGSGEASSPRSRSTAMGDDLDLDLDLRSR
jgi:myosin heavy subunit